MKENDTQAVATFNRLVQSIFDVGFMAAPCPNGMEASKGRYPWEAHSGRRIGGRKSM